MEQKQPMSPLRRNLAKGFRILKCQSYPESVGDGDLVELLQSNTLRHINDLGVQEGVAVSEGLDWLISVNPIIDESQIEGIRQQLVAAISETKA